MQIKTSGNDLISVLNVVSLTVNSKDDTNSHFLFRYKGGVLQVLSHSSRVFSLAPLIAEVDATEGESFTVEAWRLNKWVNSVGQGGVFTLTSGENGEIIAKSGKSKLKFRSLDPSRFRTWDKIFDSSTVVGKVSPSKLSEALMVSKLFVSQDDTIKPQYCQVVAWDSTLISTNRRSMSAAVIPYPGMNFRIPSKDVGTLIKFLTDKNTIESEIEVRESSRPKEEGGGDFDFFVRPDGSYFGSSRLSAKVNRLETPRRDTEVQNSVILNVEEFKQAIEVLLASAPKGHDSVRIVSQDSNIIASMPSEAGGDDSYPFAISSYKGEGSVAFTVEYSYLLSLSDLFSTDTLTLGVFSAGDGGYLSLHHDDPVTDGQIGNTYSIGVLWKGT